MSALSSGSPLNRTGLSDPHATQETAELNEPAEAAGPDPNQADFGANEWLVEELYQQYLADPASVDRAWWSFFADYKPAVANGARRAGGTPNPAQALGLAPSPADPATSPSHRPAPPQACRPQVRKPQTRRPRVVQRPPRQRRAASAQAGALGTPAAAGSAGAPATPAPATTPAAPANAATPAVPAPAGAEVSRLRGAAARTVINMASSLSRAHRDQRPHIPAKLLIDNRIVINNHLKRGRGGKVSLHPPDRLGDGRGAQGHAGENDDYDEVDGKPAVAKPAHVNLGIAIDMPSRDGTRSSSCPNIKRREHDGLPPVLDRIRGRRPQGPRQQARRRPTSPAPRSR